MLQSLLTTFKMKKKSSPVLPPAPIVSAATAARPVAHCPVRAWANALAQFCSNLLEKKKVLFQSNRIPTPGTGPIKSLLIDPPHVAATWRVPNQSAMVRWAAAAAGCVPGRCERRELAAGRVPSHPQRQIQHPQESSKLADRIKKANYNVCNG